MTPEEHRTLDLLKLDYTVHRGAIWSDTKAHVSMHNSKTYEYLLRGLDRATRSHYTSVPGAVIYGDDGSGKTHQLRQLRMHTTERNGFFIQFDADSSGEFETAVLRSYHESLTKRINQDQSQLHAFLQQFFSLISVPEPDKMPVLDGAPTPEAVEAIVDAACAKFNELDDISRDAIRVLCLRTSDSNKDRVVADAWLSARGARRRGERTKWMIDTAQHSARDTVLAIARVLALCGPTLFAIDQVDSLVKEFKGQVNEADRDRSRRRLSDLANGLMNFNEYSPRTFTVVSCLPSSWVQLQAFGVKSMDGRFDSARRLDASLTKDAARAIVAAHIDSCFAGSGCKPEWPTWPVAKEAFDTADGMKPRELLRAIADHVHSCLDLGEFTPLTSFRATSTPAPEPAAQPEHPESISQRFAELLEAADIYDLIDPATEDSSIPEVLVEALGCFGIEKGIDILALPRYAPRHCGVHVEVKVGERRLALRAVADSKGMKFKGRLNWLTEQSGMAEEDGAEAVLIRTSDTPLMTRASVAAVDLFKRGGGRMVQADHHDLRVFAALKALRNEAPSGLRAWLAKARPAGSTRLMQEIFDEHGGQPPPIAPPTLDLPVAVSDKQISFGALEDGDDAAIDLEALRKHVAVFAGSGSGKTVLLRRLIEETALRGVSSIVLDPNNDLARLKLPWPSSPSGWTASDHGKADEYFKAVEVVVWTPRVEKGRPISFQPLPDFGAVLDDADELSAALDTAVATLAPRAKVDGTGEKQEQGQAVLREGLSHYARRGGLGLDGYLQLLAEFPADVVAGLEKAPEIARRMAQNLEASRINDSLFGGSNPALDPGELLTPSNGRRARISVVSLVGLPDTQQRQNFVNQLQMALFAWIKRHPAAGRPLGGLFVMDEAQTFAPAGAMTPCTGSTLALASQARKYGLGLVFATQAPRGIHNQITGNCATQLFGYLNSPTQIAAVKEMVSAKQAKTLTSTSLNSGEFYLRAEGRQLRKVAAPMCLSYHPPSALTAEEVIALSRE
ncbi:ATP-binding protein [Glycomyces sp. NPDC021274]|uniref:ATP-binding protein n=1 Tax=Glycomyces sp. NPDC021274 TaxID=3155120 RepID=UPI0033E5007E